MRANANVIPLDPGTAAAPARLSQPRAELLAASVSLAAAKVAANRAAEPVERLASLIRRDEALRAEIDRLREFDRSTLGSWLAAGSLGPRPAVSPEIAALTGELAPPEEIEAARAALVSAEADHRQAIEALRPAAARREEVLYLAAVEATQELAGDLTEALNAALAIEARLRSVAEALRQRGATDPAAIAPAGRVLEIVAGAKSGAGVPHDHATGADLLERLVRDATATL